MNSSDELRRHSAACAKIADLVGTKEDRATWNSIAERYLRLANWYESRCSVAAQLRELRLHQKSGRHAPQT